MPPHDSPRPAARALRVALFRSPGVAADALEATRALLGSEPGFELEVIGPAEVRAGGLAAQDVVVFTGGRGSIQGRNLGPEGRAEVRAFVAAGGGYVGICAGAYMALQGEPEFHKIAFVAGRHATGDHWRRGVATVDVEPVGGGALVQLHYANGPILRAEDVEGIAPFIPLARFRADVYSPRHGTGPGEMPGTPAIVAASHGRGRILLFSPNPVLGGVGAPARSDLFLQALRFVAISAPLPSTLRFADVFSSPRRP
ncbi:MAG: BPL-N domain-containing protein [Myxococcales bacterium]|nr:BPL-N domain-containing protein [Myxococcales bacterium]